MSKPNFSDKLREAFEASGMTKRQLERASGVSYDIINKLIRGDNQSTSAKNTISLANALGFEVEGVTQRKVVLTERENNSEVVARVVERTVTAIFTAIPRADLNRATPEMLGKMVSDIVLKVQEGEEAEAVVGAVIYDFAERLRRAS